MNRLMYKQVVGDFGFKTVDQFNEADHPRVENGQFGSGGSSSEEGKAQSFAERMKAKVEASKAKKAAESNEPIQRGNAQSLEEKYKGVSNEQIEAIIKEHDKRIKSLLKTGEGEMGANGHRSTRKATSNHGAWMLSNTNEELKSLLKSRNKA